MRLGAMGRITKCSGGTKAHEVAEGIPCVRYGDLYTYHGSSITETRSFVAREHSGGYSRIRYGDVLFAASGETMEEIGKSSVNLLDGEALCGGDVILLRPTIPVTAGFLGYATNSQYVVHQKSRLGRGMTVMHIYGKQLKAVAILLPPVAEQRLIADFLDRETARIDALVAKKEESIRLLREKRTALISRAVTKGLDPDVAMRDSGIDWLGEIPAHWDVRRLRRCVSVTGGVTPPTDIGAYWNGAIPWVTPKDMKRETISDSTIQVTEDAVNRTSLSIIDSGAVLMVVRGMILAKTVPVGWTTRPVTINQDMKALRPVPGIEPQFLLRALGAARAPLLTLVEVAGHGTRRLPTDRWLALPLAIPPADEQRAIADLLHRETARIDALVGKVKAAIEHLKEYRAAVISAAVTGRIDVRDDCSDGQAPVGST